MEEPCPRLFLQLEQRGRNVPVRADLEGCVQGSLQGDSELPAPVQPSCCPATTVGRESPGLKLASSSPPRQFHHLLWQTGPCGEVMTANPSVSGQQGVRGRQHRAKSRSPIMVSLSWKRETQEKQEHLCVWNLILALLLLFLRVCTYKVYSVLFFFF